MTERVHLGISTCPNDTFTFHALLTGAVRVPGVELELELHDVQELNEALAQGRFDVAKGSFYAALLLSAELCVLRTGAALGFGNGPLLLAAAHTTGEPGEPVVDAETGLQRPPRVLTPGRWTTANLLYRLLHPGEGEREHVLFSEIMPALERGEAEFGLCIHEGRFTYRENTALRKVEDVGESWEARTGLPLPLGGILARRNLHDSLLGKVEEAIARSLDHARAHPDEALGSMRRYSQAQDDAILEAHVALYVNEHTRWLGEEGREALTALEALARKSALVGPEHPPLVVFGCP